MKKVNTTNDNPASFKKSYRITLIVIINYLIKEFNILNAVDLYKYNGSE